MAICEAFQFGGCSSVRIVCPQTFYFFSPKILRTRKVAREIYEHLHMQIVLPHIFFIFFVVVVVVNSTLRLNYEKSKGKVTPSTRSGSENSNAISK